MKKFLALLFLLPIIGWSQVDSLKTNQSVDDALNNRIGGHFNFNSKNNDTIKTDSTYNSSSFNGTVPSYTYRRTKNIDPQYIIDGKYVKKEQAKLLDPNNIESIKIEKSGKYGTIIIQTKEGFTEYDLKILDLGYESFLATQPSAETFSINFLKNKNQRYVSTWNQRFLTNNSNIYETSIDYDSQIYYGLDFEYKLYMFFKFIEHKHRISFNG